MTFRFLVVFTLALDATAFAQKTPDASLLGTWRGTSTCTDRVVLPSCADEVVVYDFKPGPKPGIIRWLADKIVDGRRVPMGELEVAWDKADDCWKAEFSSPRGKTVWKVSINGTHLTGTAERVPGGETIRRIDAKKE